MSVLQNKSPWIATHIMNIAKKRIFFCTSMIFVLPCSIFLNIWLLKSYADFEHSIQSLQFTNRQLQSRIQRQQSFEPSKIETSEANLPCDTHVKSAALEPSQEYETTRLLIKSNLKELWSYLSYNIETLMAKNKTYSSTIDFNSQLTLDKLTRGSLLREIQDRYLVLIKYWTKLGDVDGFADWRKKASRKLTEQIHRKLNESQNPKNCDESERLSCDLSITGCGIGCITYRAHHCLMHSYGSNKVMTLDGAFNYNNRFLDSVFTPITINKCSKHDFQERNVILRSIKGIPPMYLPPSIPQEFSEGLLKLAGDSAPALWVSKFTSFMLNDLPHLLSVNNVPLIQIPTPYVGLHVRRTDKITSREAKFHEAGEYMKHVELYFSKLEMLQDRTISERRVFIATDDPGAAKEFRESYPQYIFYENQDFAGQARIVGSRRSNLAQLQALADIQLLSKSEYVVCTFSSSICRIAVEMMDNGLDDIEDRYQSLDDTWYYLAQGIPIDIAIWDHKKDSNSELEIKKGDRIHYFGNHYNGYNKGRNIRTNLQGLYPGYKARRQILRNMESVVIPDWRDESDKDIQTSW